MKNQYFGDVNDYVKYSLLRSVAAHIAGRFLVCWMLTADDGRTDGGLTQYLSQPERFRNYDPRVFDALAIAVRGGRRRVDVVERSGLLGPASYHSPLLADAMPSRATYFHSVWDMATDHAAVFFDPDNGFAPTSVRAGQRHSSKYLYWSEFSAAIHLGLSTVVYQHFPRVKREVFLTRIMLQMQEIAPAFSISALYSSRVAYLIAARPADSPAIDQATGMMRKRWGERLRYAHPGGTD